MSLIALESFDTYNNYEQLARKWDMLGTYLGVSLNEGRGGGGCLSNNVVYAGELYKVLATKRVGAVAGFAMKFNSEVGFAFGGAVFVLSALDLSSTLRNHLVVSLDKDTLQLVLQETTKVGTDDVTTEIGRSTGVLQGFTWNYLECKVDAGTVEVRVNGEMWISESCDMAGGDYGFTGYSRIGIGLPGGIAWGDDFYLCDTLGTTHNDFLGDLRVKAIYPVADVAVPGATPFTRSEGAFNYANVDEQQQEDAAYNYSDALNAKDMFEMGDLTILGDVLGLQVVLVAEKDGSSVRALKSIVEPLTTEYEGADFYLGLGSPSGQVTVYELNPETNAPWTESEVNALKCGYKVSL